MRIATWNVERVKPRGWKIAPAQRRRMAEVNADVWVLTETHVDHSPGAEYSGSFSPPHLARRPELERWTAVWTRHPHHVVDRPAPHRRGTIAVEVQAPDDTPLLVYGTVIPWANERVHDDGSPARKWEVHYAEIERQAADWLELRTTRPSTPLIVLGDFNQDRDHSGWYGTHHGRRLLTDALDSAGLQCVTADNLTVHGDHTGHLVDHICVTGDVSVMQAHVWSPIDQGCRLSDHPIVAVDITVER